MLSVDPTFAVTLHRQFDVIPEHCTSSAYTVLDDNFPPLGLHTTSSVSKIAFADTIVRSV